MSFWLCLKNRTNFRFPKKPAAESLGHCCFSGSTKVDVQPLKYQGHPYWLRIVWGDLNETLSANGSHRSPLYVVSDSGEVLSWNNCLPEEKFTYLHTYKYIPTLGRLS